MKAPERKLPLRLIAGGLACGALAGAGLFVYFRKPSSDSLFIAGSDAGYVDSQQCDRPREAVPLLDRLLSRQPNDQDALYLLGQACIKLGHSSRAIEAWRKLIQLNPEHSEALYALSRNLQSTDPRLAAKYRQNLDALRQTRHITEQAESLGNFALSAAASHDWPRASERLNEAIEVCGDCRAKADLFKNLGLTHARSGDLENAERALRQARELKPGDAEIVRTLEMLRARALRPDR